MAQYCFLMSFVKYGMGLIFVCQTLLFLLSCTAPNSPIVLTTKPASLGTPDKGASPAVNFNPYTLAYFIYVNYLDNYVDN